MPKLQLKSSARPSVYGYPEPLKPPKKEEKEKVTTAVLSITAKAKARAKKTENSEDKMEVVRGSATYRPRWAPSIMRNISHVGERANYPRVAVV